MRSEVVEEWKYQASVEILIETALEILEVKFGALPVDLVARLDILPALDEAKKVNLLAGTAASLADFRREAGA